MGQIYLDYNATSPVDPEVLDAMLPFLQGEFGNPSSSYPLGKRARDAVEEARARVASLIEAAPEEIIFTGGATEASNLAIRGAVALGHGRSNIVTSNIEHPATVACCDLLERSGYGVRRVPAQRNGVVSSDDVASAIDNETAVVTVIHAQNEIGTIQPVAEISREAKRRGALVHTDAAQSVGKIPVSVKELGVDLLTIAGHKLYAPKGAGALYVRKGVKLPPLIVGAGQEHGIRPGTENVAFIVGLGAACAIASRRLDETRKRMAELSAELLSLLKSEVPGLDLAGDPVDRLPNTLNVLFPNASGNRILEACPEVLASTGSACHAGSEEPSAILTGIGISPEKALGAIRLSVGRSTTREDIQIAGKALAAAWRRVATETIEISEVGSLMGVNQ